MHARSPDVVVDYRNALPPDFDTARLKRDLQGGNNINPGAAQFWLVYRSVVGFTRILLEIQYYVYANTAASEDRSFDVSANGAQWRTLEPHEFTESADEILTVNGFFRRNYTLHLEASPMHFVRIRFQNWTYQGSVNYWQPQIPYVDAHERCDPVCGDGVCGQLDHAGRAETCLTCPQVPLISLYAA